MLKGVKIGNKFYFVSSQGLGYKIRDNITFQVALLHVSHTSI